MPVLSNWVPWHWDREQDGRVSGNDELGVIFYQLMNGAQRSQLPIGRQGSLWFIQQVETITGKLVEQHRHKGFTVGAGVQRLPAIAIQIACVIHISGDIEKSQSQEIAIRGLGTPRIRCRVIVQR